MKKLILLSELDGMKIYEPKQVFEVCMIKNSKIIDMMYMYSDSEKVHYFKDSITRKYTTVKL